jgi:hypothetical protein
MVAGLVAACAVGCGGSKNGTTGGREVSIDAFIDDFFDETACDDFDGCGDAIEGRFRFESFKACTSPDEVEAFRDLDDAFSDLCSAGVDVYIDLDVQLELTVDGSDCSGGGTIGASVVMDFSDSCIREAGGPSLGQACPQLSDELEQTPQFDGGACRVVGNVCSCSASLGQVAEGQCEDFVLDTACLEGDTLTVSNVASDSEPGIWTFTKVGAAKSETQSKGQGDLALVPRQELATRTLGQRPDFSPETIASEANVRARELALILAGTLKNRDEL